MKIQARLFATFVAYLPLEGDGQNVTLEVPDGSTVHEVVRRLGIPDEMPWIALVNGQDADPGLSLADGDSLSLFPPLAGGR